MTNTEHLDRIEAGLAIGLDERALESLTALRASLKSAENTAGDNLCWITDPATAKALPEAEFMESCRRYRQQIADERGEAVGCKTIAQLEASIEEMERHCKSWEAATQDVQCKLDCAWKTHNNYADKVERAIGKITEAEAALPIPDIIAGRLAQVEALIVERDQLIENLQDLGAREFDKQEACVDLDREVLRRGARIAALELQRDQLYERLTSAVELEQRRGDQIEKLYGIIDLVEKSNKAFSIERDQAREALRKYGKHGNDCDTRSRPDFGGPYVCTCGLSAAQ